MHHGRLEALCVEAADTMATLEAHLSTGGRLPAAWGTPTHNTTNAPGPSNRTAARSSRRRRYFGQVSNSFCIRFCRSTASGV